MKLPDLDKERCERKVTCAVFLKCYNEDLPDIFPKASLPLLRKFKETYPEMFKQGDFWSLDKHRKKVMDWLPMHIRSSLRD